MSDTADPWSPATPASSPAGSPGSIPDVSFEDIRMPPAAPYGRPGDDDDYDDDDRDDADDDDDDEEDDEDDEDDDGGDRRGTRDGTQRDERYAALRESSAVAAQRVDLASRINSSLNPVRAVSQAPRKESQQGILLYFCTPLDEAGNARKTENVITLISPGVQYAGDTWLQHQLARKRPGLHCTWQIEVKLRKADPKGAKYERTVDLRSISTDEQIDTRSPLHRGEVMPSDVVGEHELFDVPVTSAMAGQNLEEPQYGDPDESENGMQGMAQLVRAMIEQNERNSARSDARFERMLEMMASRQGGGGDELDRIEKLGSIINNIRGPQPAGDQGLEMMKIFREALDLGRSLQQGGGGGGGFSGAFERALGSIAGVAASNPGVQQAIGAAAERLVTGPRQPAAPAAHQPARTNVSVVPPSRGLPPPPPDVSSLPGAPATTAVAAAGGVAGAATVPTAIPGAAGALPAFARKGVETWTAVDYRDHRHEAIYRQISDLIATRDPRYTRPSYWAERICTEQPALVIKHMLVDVRSDDLVNEVLEACPPVSGYLRAQQPLAIRGTAEGETQVRNGVAAWVNSLLTAIRVIVAELSGPPQAPVVNQASQESAPADSKAGPDTLAPAVEERQQPGPASVAQAT